MSRVVHTNIWSAYGYARKAGYEGTEEEFEQGLKKSAEAAGNAEESASTASEAAAEANAARDAAAQSAESASTSEGNALEYANSAAQVLRDAQAVAQTVNAKANEAAGSASRAENYAQTATTKASEATTAAGTATAAATSASGSAQEADASATAAAASETNAAASASSASTSAGNASESADDAAESAAAAQAVKDSIPEDYTALSDEVTDLKSQINFVTEHYGVNLFDPAQLLAASGWTVSDGEYVGKCGDLHAAFSQSSFSIYDGFKENTQYSIRVKYYTNDTPLASGNILNLRVHYSDGTSSAVIYFAVQSAFVERSIVTAAEKTITKINLVFSNGAGADNVLHIKDFQIAEGASQPDYEPYQVSAIDLQARAEADRITGAFKNFEKRMEVKWKKGIINYNGNISTSSSTKACVTLVPNSVTRIVLEDDHYATFLCYDNNGNIGKINPSGVLDNTGSGYMRFYGEINASNLFTKYGATMLAMNVWGEGVDAIMYDADAIAYGNTYCTIYTQENADYDFVPYYFNAEIDAAIASAKTDMGACGRDGYSFIFTTDNHWNHNDGHSPAIIKAVQKATKIQDVVLGGDMIDGSADKAHELDLLQSVIRKFDSYDYRLHYVFGNHDSNTVGQTSSPSLHFSQNEVYMATQKPQEYTSNYSDDGFTDYFWDDATAKTRIIVVDSKIEGINLHESQLAWFGATLASTPESYRIIVIMHIWYSGADSIASQGQAIFDAVDAWNTEHQTKVVALFGGHAHIDADYKTPSGVPLILTTCDIPKTSLLENVDSQAVDVITVNYTDKRINCRRIGRGDDREITWD